MKFYFSGLVTAYRAMAMLGLSLEETLKKSKYYKLTGKLQPVARLMSYFYLQTKKDLEFAEQADKFPGDLLLDSGAYTWQEAVLGKGLPPPSDEEVTTYLKKFIKYVNEHKIKDFFELDIEEAVGWERYYKYLAMLEDGTGIAPRMVWHIHRGEEWLHKYGANPHYPRLAIGGIVANYDVGNVKAYEKETLLPRAVKIMRDYGKEVHGLGVTGDWFVKHVACTSIDTISWLAPILYGGTLPFFDGHSLFAKSGLSKKMKWEWPCILCFLIWYDYACGLSRIK